MATPAPKRPRPYRDFLTPALHRQFVRAGGLAFSICYVEAVYMGLTDIFWSWFPVGPTGARTLMLSISVLLVMIIRISRLHVGRRTTASPFDTFRSQLFAPSTYVAFAWYCTSALLFAEVYVWARPVDAGFTVINHGRAHERARLNERAIAFRTLFVMLGIVQSLVHLFSDRDRVPTPVRKVQKLDSKSAPTVVPVDSPSAIMKRAAPSIIVRLIWTATLFPVSAFLLYVATPLRSIAWSIAFDTLRFVYFLPPKQRNSYTGFTPILPFYIATVVQTSLLVFLWEMTNAAFSAYIAQPPLRRNMPLTSDTKGGKALDPNGSLISGLKSKKEFARATAFHELLLITYAYPERRATLFADLDRPNGNAWAQISSLCLAHIEGIIARINALNPAPAPPAQETESLIKERQRIAPPLKTDNVFATTPPMNLGTPARTGEWAKSVAAKYGNSPGAEPLRDTLKFASRKLLSDEQRESLANQPAVVGERVEGVWDRVIKSPVGYPFRQSFARSVTGIVCGSPHESAGLLCDAIDSLAWLVVQSIKEDVYGQVSKDVPRILRTYASTLKTVQSFMKETKPHWSDASFSEEERGSVREVNEVCEALAEGLGHMLEAFGEYVSGMGVGGGEVKEFRALVAGVEKARAERVRRAEEGRRRRQKTTAGQAGGASTQPAQGGPEMREARS